jgi:hypothetical protein
LVPEGFVVGFLPSTSMLFATSTLGFVEICGGSTSRIGTSSGGASSGGARSGVSSSYPMTPAAPTTPCVPIGICDQVNGTPGVLWSPFSCTTRIGVDIEADEIEAAAAAATATGEMSEESEDFDPDAEWSSEELSGEAEEPEEEPAENSWRATCIEEHLLAALVKKYPAYTDYQINTYVRDCLGDAYDELAVSQSLRKARGLLAA